MAKPEFNHVLVDVQGRVARVTLNRPTLHNAFNDALIGELTQAMQGVAADPEVRVVVLGGAGHSFCAGADLEWMRKRSDYSADENYAETMAMARMFQSVNRCPKPVIARVHGPAMAGGVGLVAAADIAVAASEAARFGLTEVKIGLVPAVISPYVVQKCGPAVSRELFLTGERFGAAKARAIGLVNHVVPDEKLDDAVQERIDALLTGAPNAMSACKELVRLVTDRSPEDVMEQTSRIIADVRVSEEGREGMRAFLEKRTPPWQQS
ncbi:MAG TPA: enoyl-CoA hydratase-related protein [Myxococcota bacterium]|jgi:methylglutaconyl-CoA hydratase|nr:enoyl-CoA hydratase-related protein [Myxococcota bacterium]